MTRSALNAPSQVQTEKKKQIKTQLLDGIDMSQERGADL
jgi:hypothetical protein